MGGGGKGKVEESGQPEVSLQTRGIVIDARFVEFIFEKSGEHAG